MSIGALGTGTWSGAQRLQPPLRDELLRQADARKRDGTAASELRPMRPDTPPEVADTGTNLPGFRLMDADGNDDGDVTELDAGLRAALLQAESTLAFARQRAGAAVDAAEDRNAVAAARSAPAAGAAAEAAFTDEEISQRSAARTGAGAAAGTDNTNNTDDTDGNGSTVGADAAPDDGARVEGRIERNFPWLPNAASNAAPSRGDAGAAAPDAVAPAPAEASGAQQPAQGPDATAQEAALQALATADADGDQRLDAGEAATPQGALGRTLNPALAAAAEPAAPAGDDADAVTASPSSPLPLREGGLDMQAERLAAWVSQQYAAAGGQAVPGVGQQVNTSA